VPPADGGTNERLFVRYDPAKGFIAQGVPDVPVGSLDELADHKLPTKVFKSCSEPSHDGSNVGCPYWFECTMSYKGLPVAEGGGPRNHCWERIKSDVQGGAIVRNVHACYWGVAQQDNSAQNNEILRVIADEGEVYEYLTTIPDPTAGRDQNGFLKWDRKLIKAKVPSFQRLGEHQKLAQHELRASIIQREQERAKNERNAKLLGVEGNPVPLDKRGRGRSQGAKQED